MVAEYSTRLLKLIVKLNEYMRRKNTDMSNFKYVLNIMAESLRFSRELIISRELDGS